MIAKITRGSRVGDLAGYLHGPGRTDEHSYGGRTGGVVIGGNLGREGDWDGSGWAADLREAAAARTERAVSRPIWHMSLRAAPADRRLSDAQWRDAVQEMGTRMGWADRPHVIVRHADDHVHVALSRVGHDGSVWLGRHDRRQAQQARQHVEHRLGLTSAPTRTSDATRHGPTHQLTQGEYRHAERTGQSPRRVVLAGRVREAASAARGQGRSGFEAALTAAGIHYRANVSPSTGRVHGYSFHLPGHHDTAGQQVWWTASTLDRSLAWTKLREGLEAPRELPTVNVPKKLLETKKHHAGRVQTAQHTAADLRDRDRLNQVPERVKKRGLDTARWWTNHAVNTHVQAIKRAAQRAEEEQQVAHVRRILRAAFPNPPRHALNQPQDTTNIQSHQEERPYTPTRHHNQDRGQGFSR